MSFLGSDTTKTDTSVFSSTVSSPSAIGGNGNLLAINAAGKGARTFNLQTSDPQIALGALALADDFSKQVTSIFSTGSDTIRSIVAGQADFSGGGTTPAPALPYNPPQTGLTLTTPMKIGIAIVVGLVVLLLFRKRT